MSTSPAYTIGVRALCEFAAKQGDLDLRFTPSPTAQEGLQAHALAASRRAGTHQAEVPLSSRFEHLLVRGRADGWDATRRRVEEVKGHRGRLEAQPANHRALHWAQARVYGWLLCEQQGLDEIEVALVYVDVDSQRETVLAERHAAEALRDHFHGLCRRFLQWARQELQHRAARDAALGALPFPHASFRAGQRPLAEAVYRAAASARCLLAQAPTGIGKTVGTLFPLLKACPTQGLDKVFFLAAKSAGRALALHALRQIAPADAAGPAVPLRAMELVARDKACEHPDKACHGDSCPLAKGFYDRLPAARAQAAAAGLLDHAGLRTIALDHGVCPYYLGQEMARWSDVVVADYNYWFDASALLHALTAANQWRVAVLVDEAHNLVERGRGMYSAALAGSAIAHVQRQAPAALRRALGRLARAWQALEDGQADDYEVHDALSATLLNALQRGLAAIGEHLAEHPAEAHPDLLAFYLEGLQFTRLAEQLGRHTLVDLTRRPPAQGGAVLCLRNVLPAPFLAPRFASARSVTLFSATLQPERFYRDTLGLPADTVSMAVPSPFRAEQLRVHVARHVSTRFRDRAHSLGAIATLIASQYDERPGNYLAFFSSHEYLRDVADQLAARCPQIPLWRQARGMSEAEQHAFLARFADDSQGIGFAVLGGSFGEAVDLPGRRLIGAFIATLGMPQVNLVNEQVSRRLDELLQAGHDYTYLFPGLQKVVQAAGRVIRTPQDEGVVHLMDDRFAQARVQRLLPAWWALPR